MNTDHGTLQPPVNASDHSTGPLDAPVTLVEYGDYECPYCYRAHPIVIALQEALGDKLRFVFRNFPLTELHPHAAHAAAAAESVAARSGERTYWQMHHAIFVHQQDSRDALSDENLVRYATESGGDPAQVKLDLDSGAHRDRVQADFISGVRSGVNGTPTFFINGVRFDGDWTRAGELKFALEREANVRVPR